MARDDSRNVIGSCKVVQLTLGLQIPNSNRPVVRASGYGPTQTIHGNVPDAEWESRDKCNKVNGSSSWGAHDNLQTVANGVDSGFSLTAHRTTCRKSDRYPNIAVKENKALTETASNAKFGESSKHPNRGAYAYSAQL